jgi:tetratricopeptide (TPR) repeat protein
MLGRGVPVDEVRAVIPPGRPSAQLLFATALWEAGLAEDAEADFRAVLSRQPHHSVARIGLVETLLGRRAYDQAVAEARLEPDGSPLEGAAMGAELFARAAAGKTEELAAAIERAPQHGAGDADVALYAAWLAAMTGGVVPATVPGEAITTALTVLEALLRVQEFDAFATLLPVYRRIGVDDRERREALARIYLRRGYLESAAEEWMEAYRVAPEARQLVGLAQVAFAQGLTDEAREFAAEAVRLDPDDLRAARLVARLAGHPVTA